MFKLCRSSLVTAVLVALCLASPAHANVGLPMLVVVWPAMWALLIPIVLLEAAIATKILHLDFVQAAEVAGIANLFSTLVGIPVTWVVLAIVELRVGKADGAYGIETFWGKILSVTVQSPWLLPYERAEWMIPAAELFLCIPFFLMSVWTEFVSAYWFTQSKLAPQDLLTWSWIANGLSYGMISLIVVVMLFRALTNQAPTETSKSKSEWLLVSSARHIALFVAIFGIGVADFLADIGVRKKGHRKDE